MPQGSHPVWLSITLEHRRCSTQQGRCLLRAAGCPLSEAPAARGRWPCPALRALAAGGQVVLDEGASMLFKNKRDRKVPPRSALPPQPPARRPRCACWGAARKLPLRSPPNTPVDAPASGASGECRQRSSSRHGVGRHTRSLCADGRARRVRQVIDVDPAVAPGDNTTRTHLETPEYMQVQLFDHIARKRG
jgi:hypothetical protein